MAATMAGMAFSSAGLGLCHAMAHALGGEFHKPHGRLNAILLPAIVTYHADAALHRYGLLGRKLGLTAGSDPVALRAFKSALLRLRRELGLPATLAELGIDPALVTQKSQALVSAILADPCCATNPVMPTSEQVARILQEVSGRG